MIGNQNYQMNSEEKNFRLWELFDRNTLPFSFPASFPPCQKGESPTIPQVRKTPNFKWYKSYKNIIKETPIIRLSFKKERMQKFIQLIMEINLSELNTDVYTNCIYTSSAGQH